MVGPYFFLTFNQRAGVFYNLAIAPVRHPYRTGAMGLKGIELPLFTSCREGGSSRQSISCWRKPFENLLRNACREIFLDAVSATSEWFSTQLDGATPSTILRCGFGLELAHGLLRQVVYKESRCWE